jgi:hypothetical protein
MTIQEKLDGKRILLLSVQLFDYENEIALQLRALGATVDYYDERPANSIYAKGIIRLKRNVYQKKIDKYYTQILKSVKHLKYDYLFVIKGEVVPVFFLKKIKELNPRCLNIFYTWDSFANCAHSVSILKYFNECYTFDSNDSVKYNINFRPLFSIEKYIEVRNQVLTKTDYNLLFIGTAHSDRYIISNKIVNWCSKNNLTSFAYYFMHGRLVFAFKKLFDSSFKYFDFKQLSFKSLDIDSIVNLYKRSAVILDINHPKQSGLTMRTFEALCAGKKLITTNNDIKKYPFYNENNICIINREEPELNREFFETPFVSIEPSLLYKMSITGWINELFLDSKNSYWISNLDDKKV